MKAQCFGTVLFHFLGKEKPVNRPKLYQRIVTGALAVMMLLSSVTPTMSAFAAEAESVPASSIVVDTGDSEAVTEEYMPQG